MLIWQFLEEFWFVRFTTDVLVECDWTWFPIYATKFLSAKRIKSKTSM